MFRSLLKMIPYAWRIQRILDEVTTGPVTDYDCQLTKYLTVVLIEMIHTNKKGTKRLKEVLKIVNCAMETLLEKDPVRMTHHLQEMDGELSADHPNKTVRQLYDMKLARSQN